MSKKKTAHEEAIEGFEALATEIGERGVTVDARESKMAKAVSEGFAGMKSVLGDLVTMMKGMKNEEEESEDENDEGTETPEPAPPRKQGAKKGNRPPPEDPDAGFDDTMRMAMDPGPDGNLIDVEPIIRQTHDLLLRAERRERENESLRSEVALLRKGQARLETLISGLIRGTASGQVAMLKAVAGVGDALADIPAPSVVGHHHMSEKGAIAGLGRFGGVVPQLGDKLKNLDERGLKVLMVKGQKQRILGDLDVARFTQSGRFSDDDKVNADVIRQLEALV